MSQFKLIKALVCVVLVAFSFPSVNAQALKKYNRSGISTFFLSSNSGMSQSELKGAESALDYSYKFYNNNLSPNVINAKPSSYTSYIKSQGIANDIVGMQFNRTNSGSMNLSLLADRAEYNATDEDVLTTGAAKRGKSLIQDFGINLVNKSYVLFIDVTSANFYENNSTRGYNGAFNFKLVKIGVGAEQVNQIYDAWVNEEDDQATRKAKNQAFDDIDFPLSDVLSKTGISITITDGIGAFRLNQSETVLRNKFLQACYDRALHEMSVAKDEFKVKVDVSSTRPISAKVGSKEGLKVDTRYFVYEYVYNEKTGGVTPDRKGVIRAKKVVNNRSKASGSSTKASKFYQIYGGTVQEGMLLEERRDKGLSFMAGYGIGEMGGGYAELQYRTGGVSNIPMLYVYANLAFDAKEYEGTDVAFFRYEGGLRKGWRIARIFEFSLLAGYGEETATFELYDETVMMKAGFLKLGTELGMSPTHNSMIFAGVDYYIPGVAKYANDTDYWSKGDNVLTSDGDNAMWTDIFEDRSGMALKIGIRFDF